MLSMLSPGLQWLRPFLPYLPTIALDLDEFCAVDPPEPPTLEPLDLLALFDPTRISLRLFAVEKVTQWVLNSAWYVLCQCSDAATPDPTTYPTTPSPLPVINPPGTTMPTNQDPCQIRRFAWIADPYWSPIYWDSIYATPAQTQVHPLPNVSSDYHDFTVDIIPHGTVHASSPVMRIDYYASLTGSPIGQQILNFTDGQTVRFTPTSGAIGYQMLIRFAASGNVEDDADVTVRHYCNGAGPGGVEQGCCPPDPTIALTLSAVLELATLIQRQLAPFAFIEGDSHGPLSGEGEFNVQGLVGVVVEIIDTLEGTVSVIDGVPETLFGTGWIRWGDALGWREREFLSAEQLVSTPYAASAMTRIGYSLPPGCEIVVTELEREP